MTTTTTRGSPDETTTFELDGSVFECRPGGYMHITTRPGEHPLAHARDIVDKVRDIHHEQGRKLRLLVDMRPVRALSRDARLLYQSEEYGANLIGCALLIDGGISRVIGNFVMGINKQPFVPTRLFTSEQNALEWLGSLSDA